MFDDFYVYDDNTITDVYGNVIDLRPKWCGSDAFASSIIGWMQIPEFK